MKVIIVGGVAGGASTAARLRRLSEDIEITMYEKSGYISYANCGLPYFIGGVIKEKSDLILQKPNHFSKRFKTTVKVKHEVLSINPKDKTVSVLDIENNHIFEDTYDKLVLSPGAKAIRPNIEGINSKKIFTLRTVEDSFRIYDLLKSTNIKSVVVVGGGFVGIETAENLKELGLDVTIIEASPQILSILDKDMIKEVQNKVINEGIKLVLNNGISSFLETEEQIVSILNDGTKIKSDFVLLALGVTPDTKITKNTNIKLGIKGSIIVNEKMETSEKDIYALGDAIEVRHYITKDKALISLAGPANKQGRIVADNIVGKESLYKGTQGSSIIKVFDLTVGVTGINERTAKASNIKYDKVVLSPLSHAGYYPDGQEMIIKVLFDSLSNLILGAQIVGKDGVDKRIDVIATAIRAGLKATDLTELELSYAPPYSSAKDPVNMAGFMIENLVENKVKQFHYEDLQFLLKEEDSFFLDVRTKTEFEMENIKGFKNIPLDDLRLNLDVIPKDKKIYVICHSGIRSYLACRILSERGYDAYNFSGGFRFYKMQ